MTLVKRITTASAIFLVASHAAATRCVPRSPETIAKTAEVAFVGTVVSIEDSPYKSSGACWPRTRSSPQCGGKLVTLNVTESLRGEVVSSTTVVSEDACYCLGTYWREGSSYLIIAKPNDAKVPGQFVAENLCKGTGIIGARTTPIVDALRNPTPTEQ